MSAGMKVPGDLKYTPTHQWARAEPDGTLTVGITDHAQDQLGDVVFIQLPETGRRLERGENCAVVESVKAASDIPSPVSGEVVAVNSALADAPQKLNEEPYAAWLFRIKPADAAEIKGLLDATAYEKLTTAD